VARTRLGRVPEYTPTQLEPDDVFLAELTTDEARLSASVREMVLQVELAYAAAMQEQGTDVDTE